MSTPNCLACQHCTFDSGWGGSEVTPPEPMELRCERGRWDTNKMATMSDVRRDILAAAEGCPDFVAEPWAKEKVEAPASWLVRRMASNWRPAFAAETMGHEPRFTEDLTKAVRFPSREAAEGFAAEQNLQRDRRGQRGRCEAVRMEVGES